MQYRSLLSFAIVVGLLVNAAEAIEFFADDFESYTLDGQVTTQGVPVYGGTWTVTNTAATVETEGQWHLVDTKGLASSEGLPNFVHFGPATIGGSTTPPYDPTGTVDGGLFMVSNSDGVEPGIYDSFLAGTTPSDPALDDRDPWDSRIENGTYTGASNDMITPSFSTVGAAGDVWLHASVSAQVGDNDEAVFDVDYSIDGGANWTNVFRRISPGTGRDFANGDFDQDLDVDGIDFLHQQRLMNFADCLNCGPDGGASENDHDTDTHRRGTDQRYSDWEKAFQGTYTPLVATVTDGNAGGHHGELDLNLGAIGGNADVKVRFRHFESRDSEFLAIDNVAVDESAPSGSASQTIFDEDFNSKTLGQMGVYEYTHLFGAFGVDSGHGGSISGFSWGAQDRPTLSYEDEDDFEATGAETADPTGRYEVGIVRNKNVHHLGHPTAEGIDGEVPFAIIDPRAEPQDSNATSLSQQSERMHTPILMNLSPYETVILEWDDEFIIDGNPFAGSVASVVVLEDTDNDGPDDDDTILGEPDKTCAGCIFAPYLPYDQFGGGAFSGGDEPIFAHHRIDITSLVDLASDKSKLYVAWQFVSARTEYWAVDNILITGDVPSLAAFATPEPASWLLMLFGIPAYVTVRRRSCVRYRR